MWNIFCNEWSKIDDRGNFYVFYYTDYYVHLSDRDCPIDNIPSGKWANHHSCFYSVQLMVGRRTALYHWLYWWSVLYVWDERCV